MVDIDGLADAGYLGKKFSRAVWSGLSPDARIELRREYRHLRKGAQVTPRMASGVILRVVAVCHWDN
jgi:hypothetical protein